MAETMKLMPADGGGVAIRMFRMGQGDCFMLAFPRDGGGEPVRMLIDCGCWGGSEDYMHCGSQKDLARKISESCGGTLEFVVATHEHADHLNCFWSSQDPYFRNIKIRNAWFAWTEDPSDVLARRLKKERRAERERAKDALNILTSAGQAGSIEAQEIRIQLERSTGDYNLRTESHALLDTSSRGPSGLQKTLTYLKQKVKGKDHIEYLKPGGCPISLPGTKVKVYVLGPPWSYKAIQLKDPEECSDSSPCKGFPKNGQRCEPCGEDLPHESLWGELAAVSDVQKAINWAHNDPTNNLSLVLAFELPESKKVLLFVGDAQVGNWLSWSSLTWDTDDGSTQTEDLLNRTVVYKVGHHGSHNGTLDGNGDEGWPSLACIGKNVHPDEFASFITAVREWACCTRGKWGWNHPFPPIKEALVAKGRTFQVDEGCPDYPELCEDSFCDHYVLDRWAHPVD